MRADDIMSVDVVTVSPDTHVRDVARKLLDRGVSAVPVVDNRGHILEIISEGDLMRRRETGGERRPSWWLSLLSTTKENAETYVKTHGLHAKDVMTRNVIAVSESTPVTEIAEILEKHRIKRVPVVHQGKIVGIVSRANLLHGLVVQKLEPASQDSAAVRKAVIDELRATGADTMIDVVVSDGTVHLWGAVGSVAQKEALQVAAENVAGVEFVVSHVGIFPQIVQGSVC